NVGTPGRECISIAEWMQPPPDVGVFLVQHHLNRIARDVSAAHPDHRAYPGWHLCQLETLTWRNRIEVTRDDVKAVLMFADAVQQQSNFSRTTSFAPLREPGAQVQAEDPRVRILEDDLEEGMFGAAGAVPGVVSDRDPAQVARGVAG